MSGMADATVIRTLPTTAARMLAVEILLTDFTDRGSECPCRSPGPVSWAS
jgi:hypothetical protein